MIVNDEGISILGRHRQTWKKKKILRVIYGDWYRRILKDMQRGNGRTIELGGGGGNFKEFKPGAITSDIEYCPWLDTCFDAHDMPFNGHSAGNIVMIDVLHHLADPVRFFKEAARVLETGGRIIMLEPFPTPFSLFVYRRVHPEPFIMDADYFDTAGENGENGVGNIPDTAKDPWDANQAMAYLLFFKQREKFLRRFGDQFKI
ncbi:MAG: methyltransferase domain-containing protein, partial [bacterium]|nr:methyltransferase domain-containing protein [bacterium]